MKQCSAYGQVKQLDEFLAVPQNVDCSADYEVIAESEGVYEKIPGEA